MTARASGVSSVLPLLTSSVKNLTDRAVSDNGGPKELIPIIPHSSRCIIMHVLEWSDNRRISLDQSEYFSFNIADEP